MLICDESSYNLVRFKLIWNQSDEARVEEFLDNYFLRTADWSNAVRDMGLVFVQGKPYPHLDVTGDFYVDSGLRIDHFALDCNGHIILIAVDEERKLSYQPLQ